jgi:hypothetical protein
MAYLNAYIVILPKEFLLIMNLVRADVQGTCKYGTRVDYILASTDSPYKFVPGTYTVISSKGTSDHHIVKVDIKRVGKSAQENAIKRGRKLNQRVVRITNHSASRGIWRLKNFLSKV